MKKRRKEQPDLRQRGQSVLQTGVFQQTQSLSLVGGLASPAHVSNYWTYAEKTRLSQHGKEYVLGKSLPRVATEGKRNPVTEFLQGGVRE